MQLSIALGRIQASFVLFSLKVEQLNCVSIIFVVLYVPLKPSPLTTWMGIGMYLEAWWVPTPAILFGSRSRQVRAKQFLCK